MTFSHHRSGLVAAARGRQLPLAFLGGDSFAGHDIGRGYLFLDFSPDSRTVSATQQGQMFTLRRVNR